MANIEVRGAYVDFPLFDAKSRSLKKQVLGKVGGKIGTDAKVPVIEALRDITLSLREGDRVALVGHNGAGKSTLLRLLSGIYEPTRGSARIVGKVSPVFDLGVGLDPEVSGYENVMIRGLFLGMTRKEMRKRVDDIAEFTELGDYLDLPLRTYSAGMRVRLAIGVVTTIDPEILILDEGSARSTRRSSPRRAVGWSTSPGAPGCWCSPRTSTTCCGSCAPPPSGWTRAGCSCTARWRRSSRLTRASPRPAAPGRPPTRRSGAPPEHTRTQCNCRGHAVETAGRPSHPDGASRCSSRPATSPGAAIARMTRWRLPPCPRPRDPPTDDPAGEDP
ncbi:ABC-type polysaccharide/polyol phosphate transport system ATPase subunit [Saccharothrix australiensis]|uniref:ABC-type polysaccharide/polyol phosphate transport system ATPase subunit n=1 Tax=Saccharothrix australiensis TaxID=2072 RepID=A0A495W1W5_9PSEU|nr:ABC-type polysaccharide/polyol phosphate transport system ATPase subunit [Saccharothrix australiensis]